MVSLRSPFDILSTNYHNKSCGDRTIIAGFRTARARRVWTTILQVSRKCKSADYYKFVEALEIVGTS